jgi:hypothetical protein
MGLRRDGALVKSTPSSWAVSAVETCMGGLSAAPVPVRS